MKEQENVYIKEKKSTDSAKLKSVTANIDALILPDFTESCISQLYNIVIDQIVSVVIFL